MKLIDKKDLVYSDGYLLDAEGEVMNVSALVEQANRIADLIELSVFVEENDVSFGQDNLPEFKPASHEPLFTFVAETPMLDEELDRKITIMKEIENQGYVEDVKLELEANYSEIAEFVTDDKFLEPDCPTKKKFSTNPLKLDSKILVKALSFAVENKEIVAYYLR